MESHRAFGESGADARAVPPLRAGERFIRKQTRPSPRSPQGEAAQRPLPLPQTRHTLSQPREAFESGPAARRKVQIDRRRAAALGLAPASLRDGDSSDSLATLRINLYLPTTQMGRYRKPGQTTPYASFSLRYLVIMASYWLVSLKVRAAISLRNAREMPPCS